ncbi:MAG: diguanylate cyclase [Acidobacteriota bacterium]
MGHEYRILVVDDAKDNVAALSDWLGRKGYQVDAANSGEQALRKVQEKRPDLILLDLLMPDLDGIEVARRLRGSKQSCRIPIIMLTARRSSADKVRGLRAGADDYITKPFDFDEVDARISTMLEKRELYQALERANARLREANEKLKRTLVTDEKTGLFNYRHFCDRAEEEFKRAKRYESDLSCLMLDLDHFKRLNDHFGHINGDRVLRELGQVLRDSARETDFVARYGGEEFAILCPHTDAVQAMAIGERIRQAVEEHRFVINNTPERVTVSVGLATYPRSRSIRNETDLLETADAALYEAKRLGRNRIVAARGPTGRPRSRAALRRLR